jgi:hypothetical protein
MTPEGGRRKLRIAVFALGLFFLAGCGSGLETEYGASEGQSINGTSVLASILKESGHEVEAAIRLNDDLAEWAGGIIRFAPYPGPPSRAEAEWYLAWLTEDPTRWLIYVVRDFDARAEYWKKVVDDLAELTDTEALDEARRSLAEAADWFQKLPAKSSAPADAATWFGVESAFDPPRTCTSLTGPWAAGVEARAAALSLHEPLTASGSAVLLAGDGKPMVVARRLGGANRVLFVANGSFLLNEPLVNHARSQLVAALVDWIGRDSSSIALVEGSFVLGGSEDSLSIWQLLKRIPSFRWIAAQIAVAALCAAFARAPRLGRPRDLDGPRPDRPAAHAEAIGALLARSGPLERARSIVAGYKRWRYPRLSVESAPAARKLRAVLASGAPVATKTEGPFDREEPGRSAAISQPPFDADITDNQRRTSDG